ncbi:MAG: EamA/RhaT family transporter [Devosia sp.]|uniref:DMT family transporter n=1 Tax=Devosia sp. TaxID=1871048 RepID=UPI00261E6B57|nr:DMT family transporter [Devosia sp.]MDB5540481.1 EamA/RhaT family transporter [Devosia sp.]
MPAGVAFSLVAYLLYSCCDAIIKGFGLSLSVFEIAFWTALFSFLPAIFTKPKGEHWRHFHNMRHPWLVHLRSLTGVIGNLCIIYAFTHIPLAETYSIAFLAPIFVVALSKTILREHVTWQRWFFLGASFCGVLLVVRPGFRELQLGHLLALGAALMGAITTTTLRKVAPVEKRVSLLGLPLGYIVIVNGLLMIPTFTMPTLHEFALLLTIGALGGTGNIVFIAATRRSPVSQIAPAQYSQIAWAIVFGAIFFHEFPDTIAWCGLVVVAFGGILNVMSDETRIRIFSRLSVFGPASVISEVSAPLGDDAKLPRRGEADDEATATTGK